MASLKEEKQTVTSDCQVILELDLAAKNFKMAVIYLFKNREQVEKINKQTVSPDNWSLLFKKDFYEHFKLKNKTCDINTSPDEFNYELDYK